MTRPLQHRLLAGLILAVVVVAPLESGAASRYHQEQQRADALYARGDYEQALSSYLKLAKKGDSFSQYRVSYIHLEALGSEEDLVEAYAWATLAAQNGQDQLINYRDTVGSLVPEKQRRKAMRRVDYYLRRWGNAAIADDAVRGAQRELRRCTGSRVGTRCGEVYAMEMPNYWGVVPGQGGGSRGGEADGGSAAASGSVSSARTEGGGGATRDIAYYNELRARIRTLNQYIGEQGGNVELGELQLLDDPPAPHDGSDGSR